MNGEPSLLNSEEQIPGPTIWAHSQKAKWEASPCSRLRVMASFLIGGPCPAEPCSEEAAREDAMSLASVRFPRRSPPTPATHGYPVLAWGESRRHLRKMNTKAGDPRRSPNHPSVLPIKKAPPFQSIVTNMVGWPEPFPQKAVPGTPTPGLASTLALPCPPQSPTCHPTYQALPQGPYPGRHPRSPQQWARAGSEAARTCS